jgi:hypothetical protein
MSPQFHRPSVRILATAVAVGVTAGAALVGTAGPAEAAAPQAQAVGRFLDGALGGSPIQSVADLHDARATYPGSTSTQNPLDVTLFGQADVPLSGKLQAPGNNVFHVGAANQVATAHANGYSFGASGAVANQGGAALGGQSGRPADATLTLSGAALPSAPIPLPGGTGAKSLGSLTAELGAVSASAQTPPGVGTAGDTHYSIGALKLVLGSPALAGVLKQLAKALDTPAPLPSSPLPHKPPQPCRFGPQALAPISIGGGVVAIDPSTGSLTVDVAALLQAMGANLNTLPANTDLLGYVTKYLSAHLSTGVQTALSNSLTDQKQNFDDCLKALPAAFPPPLSDVFAKAVAAFTAAVTKGQQQLVSALNNVTSKLGGGANPFQPLVDALRKALQIGVNVQPNGPHGSYASPLRATPDQATAVVSGQTVVRAVEIDLGGASGVNLALANAAAGPSTARPVTAPPPTPTRTPAVKHNHVLPTGIPAGQAPTGGAPQLPLELLAVGLALAAAGGLVYRLRPRRH